jgi:hypothetical protein
MSEKISHQTEGSRDTDIQVFFNNSPKIKCPRILLQNYFNNSPILIIRCSVKKCSSATIHSPRKESGNQLTKYNIYIYILEEEY